MSLEYHKRQLNIAKQTGDKAGEGRAYGGLGYSFSSLGQYEKALEYFKLWLGIAKQIGDKADEGRAYGCLGNCYSSLRQYGKALEDYKMCLDIAKQIGDKACEGMAYGDIGDCYSSLRHYDKALKHYKMCLDIAKQIGDMADEGKAYRDLGGCYSRLGQYGKALEHYKMRLDIAKQIEDKADEGKAYSDLGDYYSSLMQHGNALEHYKMRLDVAKNIEDKADEGRAYGDLGNCYSILRQYDKALEHYKMWLDIAKQIEDRESESMAYGVLGNCYSSLRQYNKALQYYQMWFDILKQMGDKEGERMAYGVLGNCYSSLGQYDKASEYQKLYLNAFKHVGHSIDPAEGLFTPADQGKITSDSAGKHDRESTEINHAMDSGQLTQQEPEGSSPVQSDKRSLERISPQESWEEVHLLPKGKHPNSNSCKKKTLLDSKIEVVQDQVKLLSAKSESKSEEALNFSWKEVDELSSVPVEILARGPNAVEAFQKALSEGKTRVRRVPIMLIGQERAGKTSLLKSLKGETFDPHEESTKGIVIDPGHCKVTQEIWKTGQSEDEDLAVAAVSFEHHAAVLTCKYLMGSQEFRGSDTLNGVRKNVEDLESTNSVSKHDSRNSRKTGGQELVVSPFKSALEDVKEESWVFPEQPALDMLPATETVASNNDTSTNHRSDVPEEIITLIEKLMQKEELEDDNDIYCTLWDFAGQSVFYTTHSLFLTHRAIYILVNDLSKSPDQETDPLRKQGLFRRPYDDSNFVRTNLDFLHYWMTSIASFGRNENIPNKESSVSLPPVIFVSTHADKPFGDAPPRDLAREVFGSLQEKPYKSHLVDDFFVVDNTRSGSGEEDKEVPRLREKILELCRELQKLQVELPLKWLKLEKTLKAAVQEGFHSLKLSEAEKVGLDVCGITDENEFRAVLDFFHDHRILVHFDDSAELDDLVVLDPQWLIDILKEVITVKPFESEQSAFVEHWRELEESGVLKRDLLEHVWRNLLNQRNTIEALVSIMEKFNLLCRWSSSSTEEYLVPHMLKSLPVNRNLTSLLSSTVVPSLFIRFLSVQSPQVCFPYLLVCLINEWRKEQPCFQRPKLYRNFVRFSLNPSDGSSLVLFCHSSVIEVALCAPSTPSGCFIGSTCGRVVRVLRRVLDHMRQECCWLKSTSYELCFRCPVCCEGKLQLSSCDVHHVVDCNKSECTHFYSEKELQDSQGPIRCEKSEVAIDTAVSLKEFSPWLEFLQDNSEHKKNRAQGDVAQRVTEHLQFLSVQDNNEHKGNRAQAAAICLPEDVMSIVQSADKVTVVQRATEHLQLDEAALMEPSADTRQKVRGLANLMKRSNREDAVRHLRTLVPSGTTGPLLDEQLPVHKMPYKERRELTVLLSGGEEWKVVANSLGFSNHEIRYLDNRTRNPADAMLVELEQRSPNCTVGHLYDVLVETEMAAVADKI